MNESLGVGELRLIDANANRAREGMRTAEDYIRFSVVNSRSAKRLKNARHAVTELLGRHFSDRTLTAHRNVSGDPLKPDLAEPKAKTGENSRTVALRGLKRAQEAMRVIEEYARASSPDASVQFAKIRFELYEVEQWLLHASVAAEIIATATVYVILTKSLCKNGLLATAEAILKGGAKLLQLRSKDPINDKELLSEARGLQCLCERYEAVWICNDRLDMALAAKAAGVHLGQDDIGPQDVRQIAGEKLIIGRSTHSVEQARTAVEVEQADYIGVGSVYDTSTKQGRILAGVALAEQVCSLGLEVPIFAIGGVTLERVKELRAAGVKRVAVSSAIAAAPDPEAATRRFLEAMAE